MEDFIQPEFPQSPFRLKANGIWQKYGFKIVLGFVALLLAICGCLIYLYYFSPSYRLNQLLPQNYDISFEFDFNRQTLPATIQREMINNPAIGQIYLSAKKEFDGYLASQPAALKDGLTRLDRFIFFLQTPDKYGIIANISDKNLLADLKTAPLSGWNSQILNKQIFIAANNEALLKEMSAQKLERNSLPYLTIYSGNWLKINLQDSFFKNQYPGQLLAGMQNILWPIADRASHYSLDITAGFNNLELSLAPNPAQPLDATRGGPVLDELLGYLPPDQALVFGIADLGEFADNLDKNNSLKAYFKSLDDYCWKNWQISLSNLTKSIKGPIIAGFDGKNWLIITVKDNQDLAESTIKKYFGQFKPKIINITLPDGSKGQEIITDTEAVKFNNYERNGWQYSIIADFKGNIGYAIQNNTLIIGNNLGDFNIQNWQYCQNSEINSIFSIIPNKLNIGSAKWLDNFKRIDLIKDTNNKIKSCLEF